MQNPHDRLFKHVFSKPEEAAGELRSVLPEPIVRRIDWSTLQPLSGTFIDQKLAELRSDVLFSVMLADGRKAFVYVLMEHQSSSDPLMAFRLLGYMVRIWESHLQEVPDAKRLPAILPVVVHHSPDGWTAPLVFSELIDLDGEWRVLLADYIPNFSYRLDEISAVTDAELFGRSMTALAVVTLFCLSRAQTSDDLIAELERYRDRLAQILNAPNGVAALAAILSYLSEVTKSPPERMHKLVQALGPRGEEAYMTAAQIWRAEGEAKGRAETLLKLLELKFGGLPEAAVQRVRRAALEDLDRWLERILNAKSLEDIFAD